MTIGRKRARRYALGWLIQACLASVIPLTQANAQPVTPQNIEQQYWTAFITYVELYQAVFFPQTVPHYTGAGGGNSNQTASSSGPPGPNPTSAPPSSGPPPALPFGGISFGFGGGRGDDRHWSEDDRRRWEGQVDIMFPPTPRDPNIANQPPPPPPPPPNLSQGTLLTSSGGTDIGQAPVLMAILTSFVAGAWDNIGLSDGGPPPPLVMNSDASFDEPVGDVVPIAGDSSPPYDDVM